MVTIKDVARLANVSIGTVSKYVNGIKIRENNRLAVESAIAFLGYRVNPSARALKTRRTRNVAIVLPDIAGAFYPQIISKIESALYARGRSALIVDSHADRELERRKIEAMLDQQVDGFVVFPIDQKTENYSRILECGRPLCIVDQALANLPCPQIVSDNETAVFDAASRLIAIGHRRIGLITGNSRNATAMERLSGYRRAVCEADCDPELIEMTPDFSREAGYRGACRLMALERPPTAFIACNYYTTLGVLCALEDRGADLRARLMFIGFDYESLPMIVRKPMGIVVQSVEEIARVTVKRLMAAIDAAAPCRAPQVIRVPTQYTQWPPDEGGC